MSEAPALRVGMVTVVGAANAGKSSLINHLMGEKVSIVSPVVQTTRNLVRAIHTEERGQVVFLDTPGVHQASKPLNAHMNKAARASTEGVDAVLLVMDRSEKPAMEAEGWMRRLARESTLPLLFLLNKSDQPDRASAELRMMWDAVALEKESTVVPEWWIVSAQTGLGCDALLARLFELMPPGPLLFPEDIVSDFPRKLAIADLIREKYFMRLHQELPHSLAVWIERLDEKEKGWDIEAHVYVRQNSQKGIVIGEKGRMMKSVRGEAATEISQIYGVHVNLTLDIRVEKDWDKNFWILRKLGYA